MKKSIKIILCLSLVAIMCTGLCSCDALDDAKKNHAVYSEDYNTITYNDSVYKICPTELRETLHTYISEKYDFTDKILYITEPDVPVLLASTVGEEANLSINGRVISLSSAYYIETVKYDTIISNAKQYLETHFGTYNEDKSKIIVNGTTYIKAPEEVHKKYNNVNKSIIDVFAYDYIMDYYYINKKDSNTLSTIYEVLYDNKILYSHDDLYYEYYYFDDYYNEEKEFLDDIYYSTYDDDLEGYVYYVYYFCEDVYDELVNELMK